MIFGGFKPKLPQIDPALGQAMLAERGLMQGDQPNLPQMPQMPQATPRPGLGTRMFGKGWEAKANALGGLLRGDPNAATDYHSEQRRAQELAQALRMKSLERDQDWQDWVRKQQWERANPTPKTNDTVADYEFIRRTLGDEWGQKFLRNRADPPRYVQGPDGQFYPVQTAQPQVLGDTLPQGWTIQGDGAGNGAGGFRP